MHIHLKHLKYIYLQLESENDSKLLNGIFVRTIASPEVNEALKACHIMKPPSSDTMTMVLYDFLPSIVLSEGSPPKYTIKDVQTNPRKSSTFMLEKVIMIQVLNNAITTAVTATKIHSSHLEFVNTID